MSPVEVGNDGSDRGAVAEDWHCASKAVVRGCDRMHRRSLIKSLCLPVARFAKIRSRAVDRPIAVLLDPAKTMSGRSRFFCQLASILQELGFKAAFAYPGKAVQRREYWYPPESVERTLRRCDTVPEGADRWTNWSPYKRDAITCESLACAIQGAELVIVPATVNAEIGKAIRAKPGFFGHLLLTDHTGLRLTAEMTAEASENYRTWMRLVDGVHTVNEGLAEIARRYGAPHVFTIPPAVDERAFISRSRLLIERAVPRRRTILVPGGLLKAKGSATVLKAFATARARYPNWRLDFFGEGPERAGLETLVRQLGLVDVVNIHGFHSDFAARYRYYPIVASATAFEALPLTLIEAMAAACVTVFPATAGGPATIIRHGKNGFLSRSDEQLDVAEALLDAMERFESISGKWQRMQVQAIQSAQMAAPREVAEAWRVHLQALECTES